MWIRPRAYCSHICGAGAEIAQLVYSLAAGWMIKDCGEIPGEGNIFSSSS
jgi:hypothetical protein